MDGLAAIARLHYDLDTTEAGTLFLFCGRKRDTEEAKLISKEARIKAAETAYDYLDENNLLITIRDEIENPNREEPINQLEPSPQLFLG